MPQVVILKSDDSPRTCRRSDGNNVVVTPNLRSACVCEDTPIWRNIFCRVYAGTQKRSLGRRRALAGPEAIRMRLRCFISHPWATNIHHFAVRLSAALRARDVEVWIDQEQMLPGQHIGMRQRNGIAYESDVFLFLLAPATLRSTNCIDELECALQCQKPIVTVLVEAAPIPELLNNSIHVDFTNPVFFEAAVDRLLEGARDRYRWCALVAMLDDQDPERRSEAASVLADMRDPTAFFAVKRRTAIESDDTVMQWLARYLATVQFDSRPMQQEALELLTMLEKSGQPLTRRMAAEGLQRIRLIDA